MLRKITLSLAFLAAVSLSAVNLNLCFTNNIRPTVRADGTDPVPPPPKPPQPHTVMA